MGANAQTSVPLYAAAEVLTAADMNISAGTGVPVFATTVTRDAAFGGAGEKVLAEGQLCYLESTNVVQYYSGAAWATVGPATSGALVYVGGGSVGTSTAVTYSSIFNSTYDNYLIIASDLQSGAANANLTFTISGITTGYFTNVGLISWGTGTVTGIAEGNNSANSGVFASVSATSGAGFNLFMNGPNLAKAKSWAGFAADPAGTYGRVGIIGKNSSTTQSTDFTLTTSSAFAAGRVDFYGYAKA